MTTSEEFPADVMKAAESCYLECEQMDSYGIIETIARAMMAYDQRDSAVRRLTPDGAVAIRQMIADGLVFADTNQDAQLIADYGLSCPHCGGSGHKDDVRELGQWQPIETAPKDGTHILAALYLWNDAKNGHCFEVVSWTGKEWSAEEYPIYPPTHWMPLPEAPAMPEGGDAA